MSDQAFYEKVLRLKDILVDVATHNQNRTPELEAEYQAIRLEWLRHPQLKSKMPEGIKDSGDLSQFRKHTQDLSQHWKERREYLKKAFSDVLTELEGKSNMPADSVISGKLTVVDSAHINEAWQKALERRSTDPEGAITMARTLLESVCKYILDELGEKHDDKTDLPQLYGAVANKLKLSPAQHSEQIFKQILGGCQSVVQGLGALRNRHGDAHGKVKAVKPADRHAELAVNLSGAMALFLLSSFEHHKRNLPKP